MKRPGHRFWIGACSLGLVLVVGLLDMERTAPGPLSAMHARVPELAGMNDCAACHGGLFTSVSEACLECHQSIDAQIVASEGLHGGIDRSEAVRCTACHAEHHGSDFGMVNSASFARAGVPDVEAFDHVLVGFVMDGQHLAIDCTACHEHAREPLPPVGEPRFGGLSADCASCHEDSHEGRMTLACDACHGQQTWDGMRSRGHAEHLALVGGHGDLSCATCHEDGTSHALDALGTRGGRLLEARECVDCHDSPHDAGFVRDIALVTSTAPGQACAACHLDEHTLFRQPAIDVAPALHVLSGFALDAPHDAARCDDCHGIRGTFAERFPGRDADACRACHEDPHAGQFVGRPSAPDDCISCHARTAFAPHRFDAPAHARMSLPLDGAHLDAECEACHVVPEARAEVRTGTRAPKPAARVFAGTPARCEECHADAHRGAFDARPALADSARGTCAVCHATDDFGDVPAKRFDHGEVTGFEVDGAHAQTACESCHPRAPERDAAGRSFGFVADHADPSRGCAACHVDPHEGAFDGPELPARIEGRADCARCHDATSFRSLPDGFDHRRWTGFALTGRHDDARCSACHAPTPPDPSGRTWTRASGERCADCHADVHAGQFRVDGVTDCARCHRAAATFADLRFDHEADARFALGDAHDALSCAACHPSVASGTSSIVRYRPLSGACVDCHGVQESVLLARRAGDLR